VLMFRLVCLGMSWVFFVLVVIFSGWLVCLVNVCLSCCWVVVWLRLLMFMLVIVVLCVVCVFVYVVVLR